MNTPTKPDIMQHKMREQTEKLLTTAQLLLKLEWEVVKQGEPVYRRTLLVLSIVSPALLVALLYKLFH